MFLIYYFCPPISFTYYILFSLTHLITLLKNFSILWSHAEVIKVTLNLNLYYCLPFLLLVLS